MRLAVPRGFPGLPGQRPPALSRLRIWFTASMGFLTDAYDLFVIGAIIDIFNAYRLPGFHDPRLEAILASSAIFAAIAGQLAMGRISDAFGRKFIYGVEAMLLAAGAILSAIAPNMIWLIASRVILGMGIGGDYPLSAVIASEYSCAENRGRLVGLVFAAQGIGAAAAVLASIGAAAMLPPDLAWRTIAAAGAVPAILVVYLRRRLPETPRYSALVKGDYAGARRAADELGIKVGSEGVVARSMGAADFIRRYWSTLLGTALPWFLMDIAFYGTGIYSATIVTGILGTPSSIVRELFEAGLPYIVGAPGYFVSVALLDRVGRKSLQMGGFLGMAIIYINRVQVRDRRRRGARALDGDILALVPHGEHRAQHDDVRAAVGGLPGEVQVHGPRDIGGGREGRRRVVHALADTGPDGLAGRRGYPGGPRDPQRPGRPRHAAAQGAGPEDPGGGIARGDGAHRGRGGARRPNDAAMGRPRIRF